MSVTYDVYVKERGRWFLECEFRWDEREEALDKARSLTRRRYVQAVKVIRERYDRITQLMTESTILDTAGESPPKSAEKHLGRKGAERPRSLAELDIWVEDGDTGWDNGDDFELPAGPVSERPHAGIRGLFAKLFTVSVLGIGLAPLTASICSGALQGIH